MTGIATRHQSGILMRSRVCGNNPGNPVCTDSERIADMWTMAGNRVQWDPSRMHRVMV